MFSYCSTIFWKFYSILSCQFARQMEVAKINGSTRFLFWTTQKRIALRIQGSATDSISPIFRKMTSKWRHHFWVFFCVITGPRRYYRCITPGMTICKFVNLFGYRSGPCISQKLFDRNRTVNSWDMGRQSWPFFSDFYHMNYGLNACACVTIVWRHMLLSWIYGIY